MAPDGYPHTRMYSFPVVRQNTTFGGKKQRMNYHILNGDSLAQEFPEKEIWGKIVVIRESFIEGPLTTHFTDEYWDKREEFISNAYGADNEDYNEQFLSQVTILDAITADDEVCLWFEDDLFCIMNLLFT